MRPTGPTHDAIARERALIAAAMAKAALQPPRELTPEERWEEERRQYRRRQSNAHYARTREKLHAVPTNVVAARREAVRGEESRQSQVREFLADWYARPGRQARGTLGVRR